MLFYILMVALATASALPSTQKCIDGCKCQNQSNNKLIITSCKSSLTLAGDSFRKINKDIINVISIEAKYIDFIEADAFHNFTNIHDIVVKNAHIGKIHPMAFSDVNNVNFIGCTFEDVPTLFSKKLLDFNIRKSNLAKIPDLNCPELMYLNLSYNYIRNIDILAFSKLPGLDTLDLSNNLIEEFPANVFVNNQELHSLYLDNNPLKEFSINTTNELEFLSLTRCNLTTFNQNATKHLDVLSELYLNENNIEHLEGIDLAYMPELQIFEISNNKIKVLYPDIFENNTKLQKIILDGNRLNFLPIFVSANDKTFETYKFSCNNCGLRNAIPSMVFERLTALNELHLSNNDIVTIEESFSQLSSLRRLDVSNNKLTYINPIAFSKNAHLENLNISGNKISVLNPEMFENNEVLNVLDASNNSLSKLWLNNNTIIDSLTKLILRNNKLRTITVEELSLTPNLNILQLDKNNLECNNDLTNSLVWLTKKDVKPYEDFTHMELTFNKDNLEYDLDETAWESFITRICVNQEKALNDFKNALDLYEDSENYDDDDEEDDEADEDDDEDDESNRLDIEDKLTQKLTDYEYEEDATFKPRIESVEELEDIHYAYIFSLSMIFFMTALFVLCVAVAITLLILRRSRTFNMHRANMPRFKIPSWSTTTGLKKHSGSVYRPLSEDLSAQTPQPRRYEFSTTPSVHSLNP